MTYTLMAILNMMIPPSPPPTMDAMNGQRCCIVGRKTNTYPEELWPICTSHACHAPTVWPFAPRKLQALQRDHPYVHRVRCSPGSYVACCSPKGLGNIGTLPPAATMALMPFPHCPNVISPFSPLPLSCQYDIQTPVTCVEILISYCAKSSETQTEQLRQESLINYQLYATTVERNVS